MSRDKVIHIRMESYEVTALAALSASLERTPTDTIRLALRSLARQRGLLPEPTPFPAPAEEPKQAA